jgi:hypothetical protein
VVEPPIALQLAVTRTGMLLRLTSEHPLYSFGIGGDFPGYPGKILLIPPLLEVKHLSDVRHDFDRLSEVIRNRNQHTIILMIGSLPLTLRDGAVLDGSANITLYVTVSNGLKFRLGQARKHAKSLLLPEEPM